MIGDRRIPVATLQARVGNLLERWIAVAPFGVHLQIAAVLAGGRPVACRVRQHAPDLGAAEKVLPELTPSLDVFAAVALLDRVFDGRRLSCIEDLADDACRPGPDPGYSRQRAISSDEIRQLGVEREDCRRRPLVAEHLLL